VSTATAPIFRSDLQERVLRFVASAAGGHSATDIARAIGAPSSSVARETSRLAGAGMLRARRAGRRVLLDPDLRDPYMRAVARAFAVEDATRPDAPRAWATVPETAAAVADELRRGDEAMALRLLLDGVNRLPLAATAHALEAALAEPVTTGDVRWDTLLGGCVQWHCRRLGVAPPRWSRKETLGTWWWPAGERALRAQTMQRTPIDFRRLGIWFDARNLEQA